jgi:nucleoside-diphosphate-sugar epimerase
MILHEMDTVARRAAAHVRCVVTGGCGFIGSHVVAALRELGHEVIVVDCAAGADEQLDICDTQGLQRIFRDNDIDVVFHIAAIADARAVLVEPTRAVQVNIGGTASILEASRHTSVQRVVLASTCWVAGAMRSGSLDEREPFLPSGAGHLYTTTKIASEIIAHDYQALYGIPFTILRYGIPYGPGMWTGLALRSFLDAAAQGRTLTIFGDGNTSRRFIYVNDLAEAHTRALQDAAMNQIYNLEGMRAVTIRELAEAVARLLGGIHIEYREDPGRIGEYKPNSQVISNSKALLELGWQPKTDLEAGLRETILWYHNHVSPLPGISRLVCDSGRK